MSSPSSSSPQHHQQSPSRNHANSRVSSRPSTLFALPLLIGLVKQQQQGDDETTAVTILEEALCYEESILYIQRFIRKTMQRRQCRDSKSNHDNDDSAVTTELRCDESRQQQRNQESHRNSEGNMTVTRNKRSHSDESEMPRKRTKVMNLDRSGEDEACSSVYVSSSTSGNGEHWLWRSLRAYPNSERIFATRLILAGMTTSGSRKHSIASDVEKMDDERISIVSSHLQQRKLQNRLIEQMIRLLNHFVLVPPPGGYNQLLLHDKKKQYVVDPPHQHTIMSPVATSRLAIEWIALLEHLWTTGSPDDILAGYGLNVADTSSSTNPCSTGSPVAAGSSSIESCIPWNAERHWKWLTRSIWDCACHVQNQRYQSSSAMTTAAAALVSLSHLALSLSIRRDCRVTASSSSTTTKDSSGNATTAVAGSHSSSGKKSSISSRVRQRANSSGSNRSNDNSVTLLTGRPRTASDASGKTKVSSKNTWNGGGNVQQISKSLQYFNSQFLWNLSDRDGIDDLSPLACLIGAFWITRDFVIHHSHCSSSSNQRYSHRNTTTSHNPHVENTTSRDDYGGGKSVLCSGDIPAAIVAMQRAATTLEQLICLSKECEVVEIDEESTDTTKKEKSNASTHRDKPKLKDGSKKSSSDQKSESGRLQRLILRQQATQELYHRDDINDHDEDEIEEEEEDEIVMEAVDEGDDDDDDVDDDATALGEMCRIAIIESEAAKTDDDEANANNNSNNATSSTDEKPDPPGDQIDKSQRTLEDAGGCDDGADDAECDDDDDDDDEDHDEEGSHIPDEEDEDIESIDRDDDEGVSIDLDDDAHFEDMNRLNSLDLEVNAGQDVEVEDDDDCDDDDDGDDDDDDDDEVVDGMDLDELTAAVEHANADLKAADSTVDKLSDGSTISKLSPTIEERKLLYVKACIQVLACHYPHNQHYQPQPSPQNGVAFNRRPLLSMKSENSLLGAINDIVKPPKKPLNIKVIMRRAPTQEEFFRGSLSRNPISLSSLKPSGSAPTGNHGSRHSSGGDDEPTVADLRQHIANDLQMADSAELIEIIVANKILDVNLKLRVVHQVLWKEHLIDNSSSSAGSSSASAFFTSGSGASYFASAGSSISMIFSGSSERGGGVRITKDTPFSSLPPMVATYRLAGVDGEATEDTIHTGDLVDPEAPSDHASPDELERLLENEFGITRVVTKDRGASILLRSVQHYVNDTLRRIRRDDVGCSSQHNTSRTTFLHSPPCHGLALLRHCSKLASNRKKLLQARAPTVLLTLLLDVLRTLEESTSSTEVVTKSNPTAEILEELIEVLTSDISSSPDVDHTSSEEYASDSDQDVASMPLLLKSIETISLSPPLRRAIAKLLPFLTYGQTDLSRELARHFNTHIIVDNLAECEKESLADASRSSILMNTFVETALILQSSIVCNALRLELLNCGFHQRLITFVMSNMPLQPPPWSAALYTKDETDEMLRRKERKAFKLQLEDAWRVFYLRGGLTTAFKVLIGICLKHHPTQNAIAKVSDFLRACHWIESTSDNSAANVATKGLGLLAETLLDELADGNDQVSKLIDVLRKETRMRKKELAESRRNLALLGMTNFGIAKSSSLGGSINVASVARDELASIFAVAEGAFCATNSSAASPRGTTPSKSTKGKKSPLTERKIEKPAWLAEAEMMEDELGLTCAVCQEGRTLQPSELLGLYAYVKKISIPIEQCGSRASIDGTNLFRALPSSLPDMLLDSHVADEWFPVSKAAAEQVSHTPSTSLTFSATGGRRNSIFTTTVSAGNGIHISCHRKARQADRTHPKAPKSEWEGASLRNNRCNCNVILPLVSSHSSKVPLISVDTALTDHQAAVSNLLGSNPKSMLWAVLHDVRFLVLRMAYGESLNVDCGGGSLASNCQLVFYQLLMADMFDQDAQVDQPQLSQHARGLSAALLTGCAVLTAKNDGNKVSHTALTRGIADAAPMAALTCILFHNCKPDDSKINPAADESIMPHPKRQWIVGNDYFLRSLLVCAGRRHALGIVGSGCQTNTRSSVRRAPSFADWDMLNENEANESDGDEMIAMAEEFLARSEGRSLEGTATCGGEKKRKIRPLSSKPSLEDFQNVLRPMLTYYAIMNQLSAEFTVAANDLQISDSAQRLEKVINACQRSKNIHELLRNANIPSMKHDDMIDLLQKGMVAC